MAVAVLGLGIIGSAWARNLINDGLEVRAWNRTPKEFPGFVEHARDAANDAEVVILVVSDPPAVSQVLDAIEPVLKAGQTVVQSSTISAKWTRLFSERVLRTGARFLEAPFTGSKLAAENRQTVFYTGGDPEALEAARPTISRLSETIQYVGSLGSASSLKLAMNVNVAIVGAALAESLTIARNAGISDDVYFEALSKNVGHSGLADLKQQKLSVQDYAPQFSVKHMRKDLRLAQEDSANLALIVTPALIELYDKGFEGGLADDDFIGLIRLLAKK